MGAIGVRLERAAKKWEPVFREKRATSKEHRGSGDSTESLRALWAALAFVVFLAASAGVPAQGGEFDSLEIVTSTGRHIFQVEIADNDATRKRGLMDRRYMAAGHGMLFEFDRDASVSFWMENTYIPLDMIFIAPSGVVTHIAANAEPLSERVIPSGGPCVAVLELNGGMAASIGLKVGDKVRHPFFKP
ncbi:MAG: DUF192 domain-containing protein [Roseiarcus sp.]